MRRNSSKLSFLLWDWGRHRDATAEEDHNGEKSEEKGEKDADKKEKEVAVQPPRSMQKSESIGSYLWNWSAMRSTPPTTPTTSVHGAALFAVATNERV